MVFLFGGANFGQCLVYGFYLCFKFGVRNIDHMQQNIRLAHFIQG